MTVTLANYDLERDFRDRIVQFKSFLVLFDLTRDDLKHE
jgi:hypothetical protein